MNPKVSTTQQRKVMTGNAAAAYAAMLCRPHVIAAYPITPSTEIIEVLYHLQAEGTLKSRMAEPEGEHSVMSILASATAAGARTFTATSSQGLFFMYEPYIFAAAHRLPIVMVDATRETSPAAVASSGQDIMMVKDAGWVHIHVDSCQEILDTVIMAYRLAEDPEILLPVTVCYDGYYLSYYSEAVDIPTQASVDSFVPWRERPHRLDPEMPMTMQPISSVPLFTEYRVKHLAALQRTKTKLEEIEGEFQKVFGRSYGGQIEEYRCEDADIVFVALGSCVGTAKTVVDQKRDEGFKVGLVKIRLFRPFPREKVAAALKGRKAVGILDRNVCFGWNCGHLLVEVKTALNDIDKRMPLLNFVGGLNGGDITLDNISGAVDAVNRAAQGEAYQELAYFDLE